MLNRRRQTRRPIAEINVVPYIDVMLVLLVIFMITAPVLTQGVTVNLPQAISETIKKAEVEPLIISVNQQGQYFLNIDSQPDKPLNTHDLMLKVAAEMALARQNHQARAVLVKGDEGVSYGKVVTAMALLKQAGVPQVGLITDDKGLKEKLDVS
ncbi:MAG: protein TolR [Legionellaceae bacterium]|nr:protein TolR [Legionellaceae bacterium]HCA89954.1 protein TolR [Legionellales bacterium]|tara:strand:+ start:1452 stop:1913 length:462 start_codon:yes stop_codon:yes gene_type:complete